MIENGNNHSFDDYMQGFNELYGSKQSVQLDVFESKGVSNEVEETYLDNNRIELDQTCSFEEQEFANDQSYVEENCIGLDQSYQFASDQADNTYLTENSVVIDQTEFIENEQLLSDRVDSTANICRSLNDCMDTNQVSAQERESRRMNIEYDISKYISNRYIIRCANKGYFSMIIIVGHTMNCRNRI